MLSYLSNIFSFNSKEKILATSALNLCESNMMMADENYNIVYMNEALVEFLSEAEESIKQDLPNFDVKSLIGKNIDFFHKNPDHQRSMLSRLESTYKTAIVVGGLSFNLIANPIFDKKNRRIGTVVEWQDGSAAGIYNAIKRSQGIIEFTPEGVIIDANDNFLKVTGYRLEEIKGKHHKIFCDEETIESQSYNQLWEQLRGGESVVSEFKRINKAGEEIWLSASYNPVKDLRNRVVRVVKVCRDITADVQKRDEVEKLSLVANETDNSVIITDINEAIEYVNPGFTKMTGYSPEEVLGKKPGDILQGPNTDVKTKKAIRKSIEEGKPAYFEILNYSKSGDSYWVSLAINPVKDEKGNIVRFISIQANISETKERALDMTLQMDAISRSQAVLELDLNGNILSANENFTQSLGYTEEELKGKNNRTILEESYANSEEYHRFWQSVAQGEFRSGEYEMVRRDGSKVTMQASYNPIYDLEGKPLRVIQYGTDITEMAMIRQENERGIREATSILESMAKGDLTRSMEQEYDGDFAAIKRAMNQTISNLASLVQRISNTASEVNNAASEISSGSIDLSQRTEEQASNLEQTAASIEEITSTVKQNSENAIEASDLAAEANEVAQDGGAVVKEVVSAMSRIEDSSKKISDIISVIDEIAFQTNLLALNAAVEAARAGDAGKGFAVVASEVRSLAGRSASASKEIKSLINESAGQVENGAALVTKAGERLTNIVTSVEQVSRIVANIANASQEQANGIDEINTAITQMDEMTQQNAALVEENTAAAQSMVDQAELLDELMGTFKIEESAYQEKIAQTPHIVTSNHDKPSGTPQERQPAAKVNTPIKTANLANGTSDAYGDDWREF
jgi:methyl-accepting chemotaxis protein